MTLLSFQCRFKIIALFLNLSFNQILRIKVLQKYQTLRFRSITGFLSITFSKNTERKWKIFKKWISLVYCVYKKSKAWRVLNEWFYFCLKENDMILSRFMWLELLSKSNILRPIPLYMMKRKNSLEFYYYDLVM